MNVETTNMNFFLANDSPTSAFVTKNIIFHAFQFVTLPGISLTFGCFLQIHVKVSHMWAYFSIAGLFQVVDGHVKKKGGKKKICRPIFFELRRFFATQPAL